MTEKMDNIKPFGYIFKVLSGAMNGIEFSLGSHSYFMCVDDDAEGQENLARNLAHAERTLYLPTTTPSHNFVINLAEDVTEKEFTATVSYPDRQETLTFAFNAICYIEGIYFALKREEESWSPDVLKGVLPVITRTETEKVPDLIATHSSRWKYQWAIAASLVLLLSVGGTVAWSNYNTAPASESGTHLLQEMLGSDKGYSVQRGGDNTYYLFAQNDQQAEWARRSVARLQPDESWIIKTPQEEETRLSRVLDRNNISFFTIRFNDLRTPTLIMSKSRNATDLPALEHTKKILLDAMPYAKNVNIELKSDQEILQMAEDGLAALGLDYQTTQSEAGVTISSSMSSGDARMTEFDHFASQFYRLWGRQYVHFSVELRDDALKEKSFKYGQDGYVKMGKSHWVFNT